jgi:hypothetical protein
MGPMRFESTHRSRAGKNSHRSDTHNGKTVMTNESRLSNRGSRKSRAAFLPLASSDFLIVVTN